MMVTIMPSSIQHEVKEPSSVRWASYITHFPKSCCSSRGQSVGSNMKMRDEQFFGINCKTWKGDKGNKYMTMVSPSLIPFEMIVMMMMLKRRMSPPGHSESFAGPIGGHTYPYESHSTWSNHLAPHHSGSTEICQIFRRRTANILLG